jgi:lincosamide nucleotidyltransferase B/F
MQPAEFDDFTQRLRTSLESRPEVVGLITLGTTADSTQRDEWSDHDFWVITKPGLHNSFCDDLSWLPDHHDIAINVSHGPNRRTILFRNRHKVEFAVFDAQEAPAGKVERYKTLIDRDRISELIQSIRTATLEQAQTQSDALENLCVLLWSACERFWRGEFLSARQYVDGFAVNQLLTLIAANEPYDSTRDSLDPRRRLELRSPALAKEIAQALENSVPETALRLLEIAERDLKHKAPHLTWDALVLVRGWIVEISRNKQKR